MAYNIIATSTVGGGGSTSITFNSIPNTYKDLAIFVSTRTDTVANSDGDYAILESFNSNTSNREQRFLYINRGTNSVLAGYTTSNVALGWSNASNHSSNAFCNGFIYVFNYASTTLQKSVQYDSVTANTTGSYYSSGGIASGMWKNTSAITSLTISTASAAKFIQYSTATLYGISEE